MITKQDIEEFGFTTMYELFDFIVSDHLRGEKEITTSLIEGMSVPQLVDFVQYCKQEEKVPHGFIVKKAIKDCLRIANNKMRKEIK